MSVVDTQERRSLGALLRSPRYEIFPTDDILEVVARNVPHEVTITVTASPRRGLPATVQLAIRLARLGYTAIPHISARLIHDRAELSQILDALRSAAIRSIFVIAGDAREPAGEFPDALSLLSALPPDHGLTDIGVTGYPETHPFIHDDVTIQAMWDKRRFATYIVSNMSFDPDAVKRWVERVRHRGGRPCPAAARIGEDRRRRRRTILARPSELGGPDVSAGRLRARAVRDRFVAGPRAAGAASRRAARVHVQRDRADGEVAARDAVAPPVKERVR